MQVHLRPKVEQRITLAHQNAVNYEVTLNTYQRH